MSDFVAAKYILDNMKNGIAPDNGRSPRGSAD